MERGFLSLRVLVSPFARVPSTLVRKQGLLMRPRLHLGNDCQINTTKQGVGGKKKRVFGVQRQEERGLGSEKEARRT